MKKILLILLVIFSANLKAQHLRVDSISGFSIDTVLEGQIFDSLEILVTNTDQVTFSDSLSIFARSSSVGGYDTLLLNYGITIPTGSVSIPLPPYAPTSNNFDDGDNIVVVWPAAHNIPITVDSLIFHIYFISTTGIDKEPGMQMQTFYPNPSTGFIYLGNDNGEDAKQVRIIDSSGKVYYHKSSIDKMINCSQWPSGIYFIEIWIRDKKRISKLILQHD